MRSFGDGGQLSRGSRRRRAPPLRIRYTFPLDICCACVAKCAQRRGGLKNLRERGRRGASRGRPGRRSVAESAMTKERAALEATRSRLEAALSEDENWRALKQIRTQPAGDQGAQSRLRDARLALLLLSNPLF